MPRCTHCRVSVSYSLPDSEDCLGNTFQLPQEAVECFLVIWTFFLAPFTLGRLATNEPFYANGVFLGTVIGSVVFAAIASYVVLRVVQSLCLEELDGQLRPGELQVFSAVQSSLFTASVMLGMGTSGNISAIFLVMTMIPSLVASVALGPYVRRGRYRYLSYGLVASFYAYGVMHTTPPLPGFERFYTCYLLSAYLAIALPIRDLMNVIWAGGVVHLKMCCLCALENHVSLAKINGDGCLHCLDRAERLEKRREEQERAVAFLMSSHARLGARSAAGMLRGGGGPLEMILELASEWRLSRAERTARAERAVAEGRCALTAKGTPCKICLREGRLCQRYHAR
ncbi:hypothetical protein T484DRAFT_1747495 [Baffinella frigidus]|nr:hypothetical protein T484DRAFT_1747495 [Cryptophyta sp. CCMP2293]